MRIGAGSLAFFLCLAASPQQSGDEKPQKIQIVPSDALTHFQSQLLGDLDRRADGTLRIGGNVVPAKTNDKGQLELDLHNDGKPRTVTAKREIISVPLKDLDEKSKDITAKLEFHKREDGAWVYRNLTTLRVAIGQELFVIVDANGNGAYDDAGADGFAWEGQTWIFPLPGPDERWCSATMEFIGLEIGPMGESPKVLGKPLATTTPAALPVLKGVNEERVRIGLAPRPEDPKLSADLQKHCGYEAKNNVLTHPEDKGKPGYTEEGNKAGMRSILSRGTPAEHVAAGMVDTYFHRQDVIRPNTLAFGVGYEGEFGGIDGRSHLAKPGARMFPILCPVPDQTGVGTTYGKESPDACPGDNQAGWPVTVYFGTPNLKLTSYSLKALGSPGPAKAPTPPQAVECYTYDPQTGASSDFTRYQECVCIIAKDPLKPATDYEVSLQVDVDGKPWSKTWRFSTGQPRGRFRGP